jgi:LmbE family N-acetylglucosaminyl deacetylase
MRPIPQARQGRWPLRSEGEAPGSDVRTPGEAGRGGERFLELLCDPRRPPIQADGVAVIVAHPDDETIGCGAQLERLDEVCVVVATDGAPRDLVDAHANGVDSAEVYAELRRRELALALALGGIPEAWLIRFGIPDQEAAFHLVDLTHRLNALFARCLTRVVLTHAYEGGHPDHDAVAFSVHAAARLRRLCGQTIAIVEMPYYAEGPNGMAVQHFVAAPGCGPEIVLRLTERERTVKRRMIAAHASQQRVLAAFATDTERFRLAPTCNFTRPPNGGRLYYERYDWGMTGERWRTLAHDALKQLELDGAPCPSPF